MRAFLKLSTFDPMHETPTRCHVCDMNLPIFYYEWRPYDAAGEAHETEGFCCSRCAVDLVKKMEHGEAREWAAESAALHAEGVEFANVEEYERSAFAATE